MSSKGKTTANLKVRSGPGMQYEPPIAFLEPGTELEILEEQGDWLKVRVMGKEGYVGRKYVEMTAAPAQPTPPAAQPPTIEKREAPPAPAKPAPPRNPRGDRTQDPQ